MKTLKMKCVEYFIISLVDFTTFQDSAKIAKRFEELRKELGTEKVDNKLELTNWLVNFYHYDSYKHCPQKVLPF